jgi:abortive infection bacteriophage resistance protein
MRFGKPALTYADQVTLLQARGLVIADRAFAENVFSHISYYRLSGYFRPFRQPGSERFNGVEFSDILALYKFDKTLRVLVADALEAVEIHFRTRFTYHLELRGGAFAYVDPIYFLPTFNHEKFLNAISDFRARIERWFRSAFSYKIQRRRVSANLDGNRVDLFWLSVKDVRLPYF